MQQALKPCVVILGAGRAPAGSVPAALQPAGRGRVLDWLLGAFNELQSPSVCFVGGYRADAVRLQYPGIEFAHNPRWSDTGPAVSLSYANLREGAATWVTYADVVYRGGAVARLQATAADIALAIDRTWSTRYANRTPAELRVAEKVCLQGATLVAMGPEISADEATGEFCGLLRLSPKASAAAKTLLLAGTLGPGATIPQLVMALVGMGWAAELVDINGDWALLDAPQDLARFVLGTKAESLQRLRPMVRQGHIGALLTVPHEAWLAKRQEWVETIQQHFAMMPLIVRSSALAEDSWHSSAAGAFTSIANVPSGDSDAVARAVDEVYASYGEPNGKNQVLVQRMLTEVALSGVVMTRTHALGAPYYVINFDSTTGRTDTVTAGDGDSLRTVYLHRDHPLDARLAPTLGPVVKAVQELEELVGHDSLDVEFATTQDGVVHILQVRPIVSRHKDLPIDDDALKACLLRASQAFARMQTPPPFVVGSSTQLSVMSDWNPAEIIGAKPRRLAFSLYRYLITDEVWAEQRARNGYRDVRPCPLLVDVLGHPYVDVRATFNSFVPASLPEPLATRLVEHYLQRLRQEPGRHDKVEFDILYTCLTFDFDERSRELLNAGFSSSDVEQLRAGLRHVTQTSVETCALDLAALDNLTARQSRIDASGVSPLDRAVLYLDDARRLGTPLFANLARAGFVAVSLLRSLENASITSAADTEKFLRSVSTVSNEFRVDAYRVAQGQLEWDAFIDKYGHLRPGTYDITSACYAKAADDYLRPIVAHATPHATHPDFAFSSVQQETIAKHLHQLNIGLDISQFEGFLRDAIRGREYAKFLFTRNLSRALELISTYGEQLGLSREDLAHLSYSDILDSRQVPVHKPEDWLLQCARRNRETFNFMQPICLPGYIATPEHFVCFEQHRAEPNFVTRKKVRAACLRLTVGDQSSVDLAGKIVLVPNADPGFDWLFAHPIAALITMYGGVNSHMAIRAAEFGLPAAIGVGELIYSELQQAAVIELDCETRKLRPVG